MRAACCRGCTSGKRLPQFVYEFDRDGREIVDKIERVLDLVRDTGGQLAQRRKLLRLDQAVLGSAEVLQRFRQFARSGLNTLEQSHVLDRDRGLVGKGRNQFNLFIGEWPDFGTRQRQDADRDALAKHRNAEDGAKTAQSLRLDKGVFRISLHVGNMNHFAFEQARPRAEPRSGTTQYV